MTYRLTVKAAEGPGMSFFTIPFAADSPFAWLSAAALVIGGLVVFRLTWPIIAAAWAGVTFPKGAAQ
jgi:hypothetical protein